MALSRHAGFFASLRRVEDRLALEEEDKEQQQSTATSPLVLLDEHPTTTTTAADSSSGPALDLLTLTRNDTLTQEEEAEEEKEEGGADIERLMALLGLSPPPPDHGDGCDCSGNDGFLANVVGVVGPKCDGEKRRIDAWIQHFHHPKTGGTEPARLAHLLLAKFSSDHDAPFPATVKEFLDRDAPSTED